MVSPFPVYINVTAFETTGILTLTLDGPQDGAQDGVFPTTLMIPALNAGEIWSELYVGYGPSDATGEASYRYCQSETQNCSPSIVVSYSPPDAPVVDLDDMYGTEWDFTLSEQTATNGCSPGESGTFPTSFSQEGNIFTSTAEVVGTYTGIVSAAEVGTYTGIVDGNSYSLGYSDPDFDDGTFINTLVTQYSASSVALSGAGVWWLTDPEGFLCRGTYNIRYTPRPSIDSITIGRMAVSEDIGNVTVTVTLTHPPVQPVVAILEIEGAATEADYAVERNIFSIGEQQTTLNLVIVDDSLVELDETIILKVVSQDSNKLIGESSTTLTIVDNDMPAISFERDEYIIDEGTTVTITLTANQPPVVQTRVELTAASALILNTDYRLSSTPIVVFQPGRHTTSFEVSVVDDQVLRPTQELHLSFGLPNNNAEHGATSETVIRVKDSLAPIAGLEVVSDSGTLLEEGQNVTLRVTLDRSFNQDTSITIVVTGGTATEGEDYTISNNPVTFPMGSTSAETVPVLLVTMGNDESEPDETIILSLDAYSNLIRDNEPGAQRTLRIRGIGLLFRIKAFLEGAQ